MFLQSKLFMSGFRSRLLSGESFVVTLVRIGAGSRMDGDNLQRALKGVRDETASVLGVDDGDARLTWIYQRRRGKSKEYAVEITIEAKENEI